MNLDRYSTLVFDCDGVVLNSNRVKTEAFRTAAKPYGEAAADALTIHHVANGGVSRYLKFAYFLEKIIPEHSPELIPEKPEEAMQRLLEDYAQTVRVGLMNCAVAESLADLRAATPRSRWMIVSGGDQMELRSIFTQRNLESHFRGGIFGSPDTKDQILARELKTGNIRRPALFLGDSRYDHEAAIAAKLEFIFVAGWSEFSNWPAYTSRYRLPVVQALGDLL